MAVEAHYCGEVSFSQEIDLCEPSISLVYNVDVNGKEDWTPADRNAVNESLHHAVLKAKFAEVQGGVSSRQRRFCLVCHRSRPPFLGAIFGSGSL